MTVSSSPAWAVNRFIGYQLFNTSDPNSTIQLPACSQTWAESVAVDMASGFENITKLTIQGSGALPSRGSAENTVLNNGEFYITTKSNKQVRVSNIKFTGEGASHRNYVYILGDTKPSLGGGFRIDHNSFNGGHAIQIYGCFGAAYGVIDSNTGYTNATSSGGGQFANVTWGTDTTFGGGGNLSWATASTVGGQDEVYFEDNTLVNNKASEERMLCDGANGARIVVRYNDLTMFYMGGHDASSADRGIFSFEAYNNIFRTFGYQINAPLSMRGGSGHFFNNQIIADDANPFYSTEGNGISL